MPKKRRKTKRTKGGKIDYTDMIKDKGKKKYKLFDL